MTALLASVMSVAEAEAALDGGVDIIDLKDPAQGALGALPEPVIRAVARMIAGRRPVSATLGDLPMDADVVGVAAARFSTYGLDVIKLGLFPGGDWPAALAAIADRTTPDTRLAAVMFADAAPDFAWIHRLPSYGFAGVMLDTADKRAGGLRAHLDPTRLHEFVARGRDAGLLVGLAGSLTLDDVPALLTLAPDYLGFRGALTRGDRVAGLDSEKLTALRAAIPRTARDQTLAARIATAAAGAQRAAHSLASAEPDTRSPKSV